MFLNELTDFGPDSDDITGTASELPAMEKCAVQLCFGWIHPVENAKLQKENCCLFWGGWVLYFQQISQLTKSVRVQEIKQLIITLASGIPFFNFNNHKSRAL